jgi:drug/metabolite transporter (DMT)-like permease
MTPHQRFLKLIQLVLIIAVVETISLICLKKGNNDGLLHFTLCGWGGYLIIVYLLCKTLSYEGIGKVNLIWNCMTIVTAFITGHLLFNEKVNKYTFYAIIFSMIAIYLMHLSSENESD